MTAPFEVVEDAVRVTGFGPMVNIGGRTLLEALHADLSAPIDVAEWPQHRRFDLRSVYPPTLLNGHPSRPEDQVSLGEELLAGYLNLFSERMQYGRPLANGALRRLRLSIESLESRFGYVNRDTVFLQQFLASASSFAQSGNASPEGLPRSETASLFAALVARRDLGLATLLLQEHLVGHAGLFSIGKADQRPIRFLIDPIVIDGLVVFLDMMGANPRPPADDIEAPWPSREEGLLKAFDCLRCIPDFPRAVVVVEPQETWAALLQRIEARIRQAAHAICGFAVQLKPLPSQAPFALCLRRDVDRPISERECKIHLSWEASFGLRSAWYFKPDTFRPALADDIVRNGGEIGWHTCHAETGDDGFIDRIRNRYRVEGCNYHGGQDASFWRGRKSLAAVAARGLTYAERVGDWTPHPLPDRDTGLVLFPAPLKVESRPAWLADHERLIRRYRGAMVVESHPDLWSEELARKFAGWKAAGAAFALPREHARCAAQTYSSTGESVTIDGATAVTIDAPFGASCELTIANGKALYSDSIKPWIDERFEMVFRKWNVENQQTRFVLR